MKRQGMVAAVGVLLAAMSIAQEADVLTNRLDRISYAIGVDIARNMKRQGMDINLDALIAGLKKGVSGEKLAIPEVVLRQSLSEAQNEVRLKQSATRGRSIAEINKTRGAIFMADNKNASGVVTLPSGLQYKILKAGEGPKPGDDNTVACNYRSTLLDGTEFICSNPGEPAKFKVKAADTQGWREALKLMPVGSKWRLFMPPQLAYGAEGAGRDVGPNETIVSDLELVAIE